jgi:hypothetical protein
MKPRVGAPFGRQSLRHHWIEPACLVQQGSAGQAEILPQETLSIAQSIGDRTNICWWVLVLARVAILTKDYPRAEQLLEEALGLARATNFRPQIAEALRCYGTLEWARGNGSAVCERAQVSLDMARQATEPIVIAWALSLLGEGYRLKG